MDHCDEEQRFDLLCTVRALFQRGLEVKECALLGFGFSPVVFVVAECPRFQFLW